MPKITRSRPGQLIVLVISMLVTSSVLAQLDNASDHPLLEGFAESTIVEYARQPDVNYRIVLGNMRRVGGQVVAEEEELLRGDLTRITYEIPDTFSGNDVMAFYRSQVEQKGYTGLFSCQGRGCGNSEYWANEVFERRSLYGPEGNQFYLAVQTENTTAYMVVYIITRANRRLYAHVEVLETGGGAEVAPVDLSLENLLDVGGLRIRNLSFSAEDRLVEADGLLPALRLLQENPTLEVYIVAHLPGPAPLDTLLRRSLQRALEVRRALIERGIDGARIVARGVGPLAPLCSEGDCRDRVELVVQ